LRWRRFSAVLLNVRFLEVLVVRLAKKGPTVAVVVFYQQLFL
jgi:hypothetical protein